MLLCENVSLRGIGRLVKSLGIVSNYTVAQHKPHKSTCNKATVINELQRQLDQFGILLSIILNLQ